MKQNSVIHLDPAIGCMDWEKGEEVYRFSNYSGDGTVTCYNIYPGICIYFHNGYMPNCISQMPFRDDQFYIDYCREGRAEWEQHDGRCFYMGTGNLQITRGTHYSQCVRFPLSHYRGMTVSICFGEAKDVLVAALKGSSLDIESLHTQFNSLTSPHIFCAEKHIDHILGEIYHIPELIRIPCLKIKVLELLLSLGSLDIVSLGSGRSCFRKTKIKKIKDIMRLLTAHPERHYTIEVLSSHFDFPITSMKKCFREVYGSSIYTYMKAYRMNAAAVRLRNTTESVTSIAMRAGYDNASKFAAAFQSVLGVTPSAYRQNCGWGG